MLLVNWLLPPRPAHSPGPVPQELQGPVRLWVGVVVVVVVGSPEIDPNTKVHVIARR